MSFLGNLLKLHDQLYKSSGGRIGQGWLGVPCLLMTSTGAKSGAERTTSLTYAKDGADYVLVASKGGAPEQPAWYYNVKKTPTVTVADGTKTFSATAQIIQRGEGDFDRLWKLVNDKNKGRYDAYQEKTERQIPIVVLTPGS
jgi:F420H(2)-dependent quinone reductase